MPSTTPARPDWMRSDLSQARTSAATFKANAHTPVAWIHNNSDHMALTTTATARDRPLE